MIYQNIQLWAEHPECVLRTYVCDEYLAKGAPLRKAMIICPGGGYEFLSERESEPIARKYLAAGMNVFVLYYSVGDGAKDMVPLIELSMAITHVRENSERYNIDPERVFVTGFSAGGHLAASSATLWNHRRVRKTLGIDKGKRAEGINRPTGTVLCYPVISAGEFAHKPSIDRLCGNVNATPEERAIFSLEKQVSSQTSPAFIWHTFADRLVSVQNTILYVEALVKNKVPVEAHIFPYGSHGLSLGTWEIGSVNEHIQCWIELAVKWIFDFDKI